MSEDEKRIDRMRFRAERAENLIDTMLEGQQEMAAEIERLKAQIKHERIQRKRLFFGQELGPWRVWGLWWKRRVFVGVSVVNQGEDWTAE